MTEPTKKENELAMEVARKCSGYSTAGHAVIIAQALADARERCAMVAEIKGFSTVTLSDGPKGPFTIQDEATKTCCENIAAAIRKGDF